MPHEPVNCGRCAHLWNREPNNPGHGRCACLARQEQTGKIRELVNLSETCEHALLSAKLDPDFMPRLRAARREAWGLNVPSILAPSEPVSKPAPPATAVDESRPDELF